MTHIAQVNLDNEHWIQYQSWFWIKNFGPKDFRYDASTGTLLLLHEQVISEFYNHHPNCDYKVHTHPEFS